MKEFDLVKLTNAGNYLDRGLYDGVHGMIIKTGLAESDVMFFNDFNIGETIIVTILNGDLMVEKETLPEAIKIGIKDKLDVDKLRQKTKFDSIDIKAYDFVELLVEDENYSKFGVHKGERGCVLEGGIIEGECLVDFTGVDNDGEIYGDCISVKVKDLKKI